VVTVAFKGNPTDVSDRFIDHVERLEGCELEAYPDPASPLGRATTKLGHHVREYRLVPGWEQMSGVPWTIGIGSTDPAVQPGTRITRAECAARLRHNVRTAVDAVNRLVTVPLTANQFDALVLLTFNIGVGSPERHGFKQSTVLTCLNKKNYADAARAFLLWHKAGGVPHVLDSRRRAEMALFLEPDPVVIADETKKKEV
jgi:lysozyme